MECLEQSLERCAIANQKLADISNSDRWVVIQWCQKLPIIAQIIWQLGGLYLWLLVNEESDRDA